MSNTLRGFLSELIDKTWAVLLFFGTVLLIIGAADHVSVKGLNIDQKVSHGSCIVMNVSGGMLILIGCILAIATAKGSKGMKRRVLPNKARYSILNPRRGEKKHGEILISGKLALHTPEQDIRLVLATQDRSKFWPQEKVEIDPAEMVWSGRVWLYEEPSDNADVLLVNVGQSGGQLFDYYFLAGRKCALPWLPVGSMIYDELTLENG